jgi:hypothetical protein
LHRYVGPAGKIVNDLRRDRHPESPAAQTTPNTQIPPGARPRVVTDIADTSLAGNSREQRHAEQVMLARLTDQFRITLRPSGRAISAASATAPT